MKKQQYVIINVLVLQNSLIALEGNMKTFVEEFEITEEEKEFIIKFIAERFRNYVFMAAENITKQGLESLWNVKYKSGDTITLNLSLVQVSGDILVALGKFRRG